MTKVSDGILNVNDSLDVEFEQLQFIVRNLLMEAAISDKREIKLTEENVVIGSSNFNRVADFLKQQGCQVHIQGVMKNGDYYAADWYNEHAVVNAICSVRYSDCEVRSSTLTARW